MDVFDSPPLISQAIQDVCAKTTWNSGVVFLCEWNTGGVAEVRNSILNCVRYAMIAGGSLVVPKVVVGEQYGKVWAGNATEMDYMFDKQHFIDSIRLSCPQMRIYIRIESIKDRKKAYGPVWLSPQSLVKNPNLGYLLAGQWREMFHQWLSQYLTSGLEGPIIVELGRSFLQFPIMSDGKIFSDHFGKLLKVNRKARELATTTLLKFFETHNIRLEYNFPILPQAFLGVYFSADLSKKNVSKEDQPNTVYEKQAKLYLQQADMKKLPLIYVSSDADSDIPHFISDAAAVNITATSKFDLLKGRDRDHLVKMTKDQKALVDFLVMSRGTDFASVAHSSLGWNIALRRHQFVGLNAAGVEHLEGEQSLADLFSRVYGVRGGHPEYAACMWP